MYNELIESIPEDLTVLECIIGINWTIIRSERGIGTAMTMKGSKAGTEIKSITGMKLRELAGYVKSWNMLQASLGQAAINSALNTQASVTAIIGSPVVKTDNPDESNAFSQFLPEINGKKVTIIGHFPKIEYLSSSCCLSILEREPQPGDYPDPACEYILPEQDYVFITGTTFINKTISRLLELSKNAKVIMVGPSVPISPILFKYGVNTIAGMVVLDERIFLRGVKEGARLGTFRHGGQMVCIRR